MREDGSDWVPSQSARICSAHFVGNCRKESEAHPSYVPTIFPAVYGRKKAPNTGKAQKMLKSTGQGRPQPPLLEAPQPVSDWDPLQMLVDVATEAASFKRTSTVGTQCNRVPLRLLSSASGGRDGSTQVACAEQVDAGTSTEDDWLRQTGVLGLESPRDAKHTLQECSVVTTAFGLSPSPTPGTSHHNNRLNPSLPVSFANLPNNAQLELRAGANPAAVGGHAKVDICLQLESGERLVAPFPSSASLLDVVRHWPDKTEDQGADHAMDLVCVYMRQEVVGKDKLRETTLQNLGLTSGKAVIRLLRRPAGTAGQQAHVSRHFAVPFKKEEGACREHVQRQSPSREKSPPPAPVATVTPARAQSPPRAQSPVSERKVATKPAMDASAGHTLGGAAPKAVSMAHAPPNGPPATSASAPSQSEKPLMMKDEDVKYIGQRKAVLFNLEHCPPLSAEEPDDSFFKLTVEDAKYLAADYKRQREELEERPLETSELRHARAKRLSLQYRSALIRIYFPDRLVLQAIFQPEERVGDVIQFVRGFLRNGRQKFYLYTSPPKTVLEERTSLVEADLVPASVVHFGSEENPHGPLLRDEVMALISSPDGASTSALRLRSKRNIVPQDVDMEAQAPAPTSEREASRGSDPPPQRVSGGPDRETSPQRKTAASEKPPPKWFTMGKK
ncbi:tether containing UBX domain for GLUT4 isoform X1 [Ixodes scapularis]